MNLKSKLRRTSAVLAGAILGLGGVAVFAAPASAHHSEVKGSAICDTTTGEWVVDWTVNAIGRDQGQPYRFLKVESTPAENPVEGIVQTPDDANPAFPHKSNQELKGTQRVPGTAKEASLSVQAKWDNEHREYTPASASVTFEGECTVPTPGTPAPDAKLVSTCEGVTVTLINGKDAKVDAEFTVTGSKGFSEEHVVKVGGEPVEVKIPADKAKKVVVTEKNSKEPVLKGKYEEPENCKPAEDKSERFIEVTCDSLIFTIDNTKGVKTIVAKFTPNKGEAKDLTVKVGEKGSVTFEGAKGLEVVPSEAGVTYDTIKWDSVEKPEECEKPTTPPSTAPTTSAPEAPGQGGGEEDGPTLPVTGPVAGGIAGGAALLLAVGGGLFFMARRRKLKFTA